MCEFCPITGACSVCRSHSAVKDVSDAVGRMVFWSLVVAFAAVAATSALIALAVRRFLLGW